MTGGDDEPVTLGRPHKSNPGRGHHAQDDCAPRTIETPAGTVQVGLRVEASELHGTVDWTLTFPDGGVAKAASRVIPHCDRAIYTFVLEAPPVSLECLEGALQEQSRILTTELATLARRLDEDGRANA